MDTIIHTAIDWKRTLSCSLHLEVRCKYTTILMAITMNADDVTTDFSEK
jgi:hypothetical protein